MLDYDCCAIGGYYSSSGDERIVTACKLLRLIGVTTQVMGLSPKENRSSSTILCQSCWDWTMKSMEVMCSRYLIIAASVSREEANSKMEERKHWFSENLESIDLEMMVICSLLFLGCTFRPFRCWICCCCDSERIENINCVVMSLFNNGLRVIGDCCYCLLC